MIPLVIAHRGASAREAENSLAAFRAAADLGADAVELDAHSTADGGLVVYHDDDIKGRPIARLTLAQVREHRLPNGERVPTLEEALAAIQPRMTALVEAKSLEAEWDQRFLECLDRAPAPDRVAVHGFDHRIIKRLGDRRPGLPRGILSSSYPVHPEREMEDAGAGVLWEYAALVDVPLVASVHAAGGRLYAWTVDDPAFMQRLLAMGVDGLCSNHPDRARKAVDSLSL